MEENILNVSCMFCQFLSLLSFSYCLESKLIAAFIPPPPLSQILELNPQYSFYFWAALLSISTPAGPAASDSSQCSHTPSFLCYCRTARSHSYN